MDILAVTLRLSISERMARYGNETIRDVWPEYYSSHNERIEKIGNAIASVRQGKDVGDFLNQDNVDTYGRLIEELTGIWTKCQDKTAVLEEHEKKTRRSVLKRDAVMIALGIVSGVAVSVLSYIIIRLLS